MMGTHNPPEDASTKVEMNVEDPKTKKEKYGPVVLYHAGCWDGYVAAWLLRRGLLTEHTSQIIDEMDFIPVRHGEPVPEEAKNKNRRLYILDFSYSQDVLRELAEGRNSTVVAMTVLDHHKTFYETSVALSALPFCHFIYSERLSGAGMVWEYLPNRQPLLRLEMKWLEAEMLMRYAQDRDLWQFSMVYSREINAYIRSFKFDFEVCDMLATELAVAFRINSVTPETTAAALRESMYAQGAAILRETDKIAASQASHAKEVNFFRHKMFVVNNTTYISETLEKIYTHCCDDIAASYFISSTNRVHFSLRSAPHGPDVSEIAKAMGGGGHACAAGFETTIKGLRKILKGQLA